MARKSSSKLDQALACIETTITLRTVTLLMLPYNGSPGHLIREKFPPRARQNLESKYIHRNFALTKHREIYG
jgi:hypothetical protein